MTKTIVLINGEKLVGKSTFAEHLANLLLEGGVQSSAYSFVEPIEFALRALMSRTYGRSMSSVPYSELKTMPVVPGLPFVGRDWMIQNGDNMRGLHQYTLQVIFCNHVKQNPEIDCWIIENWGFASELDFFREPGAVDSLGDFRVVTVHLGERASRKYTCGEQFDGDNRFNLDCRADWIDPPVNVIARQVDPVGTYEVNTIAIQFASAGTLGSEHPSEAEPDEEEAVA